VGIHLASAKVTGNIYRIATSWTHPNAMHAAALWLHNVAGWSTKVDVDTKVRRRDLLAEMHEDELMALARRQ
jgi:hypothetical protein